MLVPFQDYIINIAITDLDRSPVYGMGESISVSYDVKAVTTIEDGQETTEELDADSEFDCMGLPDDIFEDRFTDKVIEIGLKDGFE